MFHEEKDLLKINFNVRLDNKTHMRFAIAASLLTSDAMMIVK